MTDTVKVIIEIPKKIYEHACDGVVKFVTAEMDVEIEKAVKKGVLLDDVTTEIKRLKHQYTDVSGYRWWNNAIDNCLNEIRDVCDVESEK